MKTKIKSSDVFLAIPPGETIAAELEAREATVEDFATSVGLEPDAARSLVRGEGIITAEIASKLGDYFGGSAAFWQRLESQYRDALAEAKPTSLPSREPGGNIALRVPKSLHRRILRLAAIEGVSMNHCLLAIVAEGVARQEIQHSPKG